MEITKDTSVEEIINKCSKSLEVFKKYGIVVFVCGEPVWDTLAGVCQKAGIQVDIIISEIKKVCFSQ